MPRERGENVDDEEGESILWYSVKPRRALDTSMVLMTATAVTVMEAEVEVEVEAAAARNACVCS